MTDTGLQKMTTPHRMLRKGPEHIQYIDLTGNRVSPRCLKFLSPFRELHSVLLPLETYDVKQGIPQWQLKKADYQPLKIVTRGWAASVIDRWMKHASASRKKPDKGSQARNFYCKPKSKTAILKKNPATESAEQSSVCLLATRSRSDVRPTFEGFGNAKETVNPHTRHLAILRNKHKQKCRTTKENSDSELLDLYEDDTSLGEKELNASMKTKKLSKLLNTGNKLSAIDAELMNQYRAGNKLSTMDVELLNLYSSGSKLSAVDADLFKQHSSSDKMSKMDAELMKQYTVESESKKFSKESDSDLLDRLTGNDIKPDLRNKCKSKPKLLTASLLNDSRKCYRSHYNCDFERKDLKSKRWDGLDKLNPSKRRRTNLS